jgi:predicted transposase YdaD
VAGKPFDPTFKALVEAAPEDWLPFVGEPRAPVEVIDADVATVSGAADKALHVRAAEPYLVHLEFVAGHDAADLPGLLQLRNTLLAHRHRLPVRSVAVLLRPEADSPAVTGEHARAFRGEPPYSLFRYRVVRVWQIPPAVLLTGGVGTLPLAPISAVTEAELPGIMRQMEERLRQPKVRRRAEDLWAATFIVLGLRYSQRIARELMRGVLAMKESVTYQAIIEEGKAEGKAQGKAEGALAEAKKLLLLLGHIHLGPPDARTKAAVERIDELARLEDLHLRLRGVGSWRELLGRATGKRS